MPSKTAKALRTSIFAGITAATALAWAPPGETRVTRIVIDSTEPIAGQPYQELTGRAWVSSIRAVRRTR